MKLDIKGFKGTLLNWLLPVLLEYLSLLLMNMTLKARNDLREAVLKFSEECKKTSNKYDDMMADILKNLLSIRED